MESERFEALIDAILAIIITIIVLEIPTPANGSWQALGELHLEFIVYLISFIVCFNYWNYHNNLFSIVNYIDYKVIWSSGLSIFILSLLPYLTSFVANNFHSFFAQSIYGLDFLLVNLIYIYTSESLKNADKGNIALQVALDKNYEFYSNNSYHHNRICNWLFLLSSSNNCFLFSCNNYHMVHAIHN